MASIFPCDKYADCVESSPLTGVAVQTADTNCYWAIGYAKPPEELGSDWGDFGGVATAVNCSSQANAQSDANHAALVKARTPRTATPPVFPAPLATLPVPLLHETGQMIITEDNQIIIAE